MNEEELIRALTIRLSSLYFDEKDFGRFQAGNRSDMLIGTGFTCIIYLITILKYKLVEGLLHSR